VSVLSTDGVPEEAVPPAEVSDRAARHIFEIDAECVVGVHFAAVVRDDVPVVEQLVSVHFLTQCLYLRLIQALEWMHKLDLFDNENLSCVHIHRFIDLSRGARAQQFALGPLQNFTLDFGLFLLYKIVCHDLRLKLLLQSIVVKFVFLRGLVVKLLQSFGLCVFCFRELLIGGRSFARAGLLFFQVRHCVRDGGNSVVDSHRVASAVPQVGEVKDFV
jgi:hypothetical protein